MTLRIFPSAPATASTSWISSKTIKLAVPWRSNRDTGSSSNRSSTDSASTRGLRCREAVKPPPPSDSPTGDVPCPEQVLDVLAHRPLESVVCALDPNDDLGDRQDVLEIDEHRRHTVALRALHA